MSKAKFKKKSLEQLECLRAYAKANGMTDQAIADLLGLQREGVSRMLSGKHIPRLDTFMRLCHVVGLPFVDLCSRTKKK